MLMALLHRAARADPEKAAIVWGDQRLSYRELEARVGTFAAGLRALGVGPGDCVAAVLPNRPEFVIGLLATAALRAIYLPLNPQYPGPELERYLADGRARIVISGTSTLDACRAVAGTINPPPALIAVGAAAHDAIPFDTVSGEPIRTQGEPFAGRALYLYTSGSTDTFKRICCTQENLHFEALNFVETVGLTAEDTILAAVPLFHSYGIGNCLMDALYVGATLAILDTSPGTGEAEAPFAAQCGRLAELVRAERVRVFPGTPYQFSLLAALPQTFPIDLAGLKLCLSSGDVLPKRTFDRFLARHGQVIRSLYGSTEAASIAVDAGPPVEVRFGSVGRPLENVTVEIRSADLAPLAAGLEGEIWVSSPALAAGGYDNRAELTAQAFRDGFYRTGDVGRFEADGRLAITGRKQSFVDIAGYKVDLGEVEEALADCPGVREAAAVGLSLGSMGGLIKGVVVGEPGLTEQAVRAFCRGRLAFVKVPRLIELRDALPRSPTGKVLRNALADVSGYLAGVRDPASLRLVDQARAAPPEPRLRLLRRLVQAQAAAVLGVAPGEVPLGRGFAELHMDSFAAVELNARLGCLFELALPETLAFDHPTVEAMAAFLTSLIDETRETERLEVP